MEPKVTTKVTNSWEASLKPDSSSSISLSGRSDSEGVHVRVRRDFSVGIYNETETKTDDAHVNLTNEQFIVLAGEALEKIGYEIVKKPDGKKGT